MNKTERHADYVLKRLAADIFPEFGRLPIGELTPATFRDAAQKIEARGVVDVARRNLQTCGQIMRYAVSNDLVSRNPVAEVRPSDMLKPRRKKRNYARVSEQELPQLLRDIDAYVGGDPTRYSLQLMALTCVSWYNHEHRHSGIQFVTPAQRHTKCDGQILANRSAVYEAAKLANPARWRGRCVRNWRRIDVVLLNPDKVHEGLSETVKLVA